MENPEYKDMAGKIFSAYKETLEQFPVAVPEMTNSFIHFGQSPIQIIISGIKEDPKNKLLIEAIYKMLLPYKILVRASESEKTGLLYQKMDILKNIPTGNKTIVLLN